jgi:hypothetical protein
MAKKVATAKKPKRSRLAEDIFALKGGTAINFFFRDLPRLSVDIDLTYLPLTDRGKALQDIQDALQRIATRIKRKQPGAKIIPRVSRETSLGSFEKEFRGMVLEPVTCELLEEERNRLLEEIKTGLTDEERIFIVSVKEGKPRWDLIGLAGIERLPAIRWKLLNIEKMTPRKHEEALVRLKEFLGM